MILKNTNQRFEWFGIYRVCAKVQGIFVAGLECTNVGTALWYVCLVLLIEHIRTGMQTVLASRSYVLLYEGLQTVLYVQYPQVTAAQAPPSSQEREIAFGLGHLSWLHRHGAPRCVPCSTSLLINH